MMHLDKIINDFVNSLPGGNVWPTLIFGSLALFLPVFIHLSKRDDDISRMENTHNQ